MEIVKVKVKDLPEHRTPMLNYARILLKEGYSEDTVVEFYREKETPDMVFHHLGRCAQLTVREEPNVHFAKYRPFNSSRRPIKALS